MFERERRERGLKFEGREGCVGYILIRERKRESNRKRKEIVWAVLKGNGNA